MSLLLAGVAAVSLQAPAFAQDAPPPAPGDAPAGAPAGAEAEAAEAAPGHDRRGSARRRVRRRGGRGDRRHRHARARRGGRRHRARAPARSARHPGLGAGSISELLDALAPQTRSGRGREGGRPVILLNGRRISGFSEIRDIPPEAIERVDILPEEVALKYGYRADQRVVNIVLRRRFRAVTAEANGGLRHRGRTGDLRRRRQHAADQPGRRGSASTPNISMPTPVRERARHHPVDSRSRRTRRFPDLAFRDRPGIARRHGQPDRLRRTSRRP